MIVRTNVSGRTITSHAFFRLKYHSSQIFVRLSFLPGKFGLVSCFIGVKNAGSDIGNLGSGSENTASRSHRKAQNGMRVSVLPFPSKIANADQIITNLNPVDLHAVTQRDSAARQRDNSIATVAKSGTEAH